MHPIDETDVALLRLLTHASGRPVTWLALFARPGEPDFHHTHTVPRLGDLLTRAIPQVSPRPIFMQGDLRNPTMYSTYRAWQPAFQRPGLSRSPCTSSRPFVPPLWRTLPCGNASICGSKRGCLS